MNQLFKTLSGLGFDTWFFLRLDIDLHHLWGLRQTNIGIHSTCDILISSQAGASSTESSLGLTSTSIVSGAWGKLLLELTWSMIYIISGLGFVNRIFLRLDFNLHHLWGLRQTNIGIHSTCDILIISGRGFVHRVFLRLDFNLHRLWGLRHTDDDI